MSERTYGLCNKISENKTRCIKSIHGGGRWPSFHQCHRKRGYGPDGLYCKVHDPAAVKKREDIREAKWKAESEAFSKDWREKAHGPALLKSAENLIRIFDRGLPEGSIGDTACKEARAAIAAYKGESGDKPK